MALDRTKPIQTRDGRPVRIITWTEGSKLYPIVGFVGDENVPESWTAEGEFIVGQTYEGGNDLVNVPPKQTVTWHRCSTVNGGYVGGTYDSSETARDGVFAYTLVGLVKVTWEDGKPVSVELEEV